jgi:hypothetical protein
MTIGTCDNCDRHNVPVRSMTGTYVGDTTQCYLCTGWNESDPFGELCQCEACRRDGFQHASSCAVHNGPALPLAPCNCRADTEDDRRKWGFS